MRSKLTCNAAAGIATVAACLLFGPAQADDAGTRIRTSGGRSDWAKVVHVQPLHRTVRVATPHRECWDEPVRRYRTSTYSAPGYYSYTPTIIGTLVGGAIGYQFGSGTGQAVATAAGALLGNSVARDVQHHNRYQAARQSYTTYERRCETVHNYQEEHRPDGFLVDYEYDGRLYTARTRHHPGDKIRVNVSVKPQG